MQILETRRLVLRHPVPEDLDSLYALYKDPEMRRFFPEGTLSFEDTKDELEWFLHGHPRHPELGLWATILKESGQFIGRCGLIPWTIDGVLEVEVAYMIDKRFWRQGLGAEAAQALVRYGFEELHLTRIIALIHPEHEASIRTAQKTGLAFDREIEMDGMLGPVYAIAKPTEADQGNRAL